VSVCVRAECLCWEGGGREGGWATPRCVLRRTPARFIREDLERGTRRTAGGRRERDERSDERGGWNPAAWRERGKKMWPRGLLLSAACSFLNFLWPVSAFVCARVGARACRCPCGARATRRERECVVVKRRFFFSTSLVSSRSAHLSQAPAPKP